MHAHEISQLPIWVAPHFQSGLLHYYMKNHFLVDTNDLNCSIIFRICDAKVVKCLLIPKFSRCFFLYEVLFCWAAIVFLYIFPLHAAAWRGVMLFNSKRSLETELILVSCLDQMSCRFIEGIVSYVKKKL